MRATVLFAMTLLCLSLVTADALAFGKKARNNPPEDCPCGPPVLPTEYKATPYGYVQSSVFPGYAGPNGYNRMLYPNLPFNPAVPIAPVAPTAPVPPTPPVTPEPGK